MRLDSMDTARIFDSLDKCARFDVRTIHVDPIFYDTIPLVLDNIHRRKSLADLLGRISFHNTPSHSGHP
jgi:hypothetical protein